MDLGPINQTVNLAVSDEAAKVGHLRQLGFAMEGKKVGGRMLRKKVDGKKLGFGSILNMGERKVDKQSSDWPFNSLPITIVHSAVIRTDRGSMIGRQGRKIL